MGYFWPSEVAKFTIKDQFTSYYGLKLETTAELDSLGAPCIGDSGYSYSKEGTEKIH